ncbi:MAG: hypothetical protein WDZ90_00760 [Candidatus Paceibacterota bacterium]
MPVVRVSCLPKVSQDELREYHQGIVAAIADISEIGVETEDDVVCLFPKDMMVYGLGSVIEIEVFSLFEKPERTPEVRQRLAEALCQVTREHFPDTNVIGCTVTPLNPEQGFAVSKRGPDMTVGTGTTHA